MSNLFTASLGKLYQISLDESPYPAFRDEEQFLRYVHGFGYKLMCKPGDIFIPIEPANWNSGEFYKILYKNQIYYIARTLVHNSKRLIE